MAEKNKETKEDKKKDDGESTVRQENKEPDPTRYGDWESNGRCIDF